MGTEPKQSLSWSEELDEALLRDGYTPPTRSRINTRLVDTAGRLTEEPQSEDMNFLHGILCQVGLPRRAIITDRFERTSGNTSLLLEAGSLWSGCNWIRQPLPYGTKPRLALIHICSEAILKKSPSVDVGHSTRDFLLRLGLDTGGKEYARFTCQMQALAACNMTLGYAETTIATKPVKRFSAWFSSQGGQRALWPGEIELSSDFFQSLTTHAVPIEPRALGALQHSALAIDVYVWLTYRLHRISSRSGVFLRWEALRAQFGQEYTDPRNFRKSFRLALLTASAVYPHARIELTTSGLLLLPSPPPVRKTVVTVHKQVKL